MPDIDLYAVLGLAREPTPDEAAIKAAFRKHAMRSHPDVGGDPDAFRRVQLAHDILIDPDRRARYDATGDAAEEHADNVNAEVMTVLSGALDAAIDMGQQRGIDVIKFDVVAAMVAAIQNRLEEIARQQIPAMLAVPRMIALAERFTVKEGSPNRMKPIIEGRINGLKERLEKMAHTQDVLVKARDIVKTHGFRWDGMPGDVASPAPLLGYAQQFQRFVDAT